MTASTDPLNPVTPVLPPRDGLAIIGMDCLFPDAIGIDAFWQNVLNRHCSIGPIKDRYLPVSIREQYGSCLGALMPDMAIKPQQFRLPPNVTRNFDPRVLPMLEVVRRVLDASPDVRRDSMLAVLCCQKMFPKEEASTLANRRLKTVALLDELKSLQGMPPEDVDRIRAEFAEAYDQYFPNPGFEGFLAESASLMTSIIPKAFNVGGGHIAMDATCASVITAIQVAWDALYSGHNDSAIIAAMSPEAVPSRFAHYAQLGIFTRDAVLPFDEAASGSALGEGIGVMLVKRLQDAEAAGDTIYGVIRGVGFSSDRGGSGFVSPQRDGQVRAIEAAYRMAGIDPRLVRLVEAHATGTPKGDMTELESLEAVLGKPAEYPEKVVLGSVKGNIGHLLAASGMAGIFKVCRSLAEGILPPTIFRNLRPELRDDSTRFELLKEPRPWLEEDSRRFAAVSSFGFGGVNAHAILEAHPSTAKGLRSMQAAKSISPMSTQISAEAPVTSETLIPVESASTLQQVIASETTSGDYVMLSEVEVQAEVLSIIANCTGYEVSELQLDHDLDADLGVDSIKHMEILLGVGERFRVQAEDGDQITDYPTVAKLVDLAVSRQNTSTGEQPAGLMAELMAGLQSGDVPGEAMEKLAQLGSPGIEAPIAIPPQPEAVVEVTATVVEMVTVQALVPEVMAEPVVQALVIAAPASDYVMLSEPEVQAEVLSIIANCTGYEVSELQLDHDLDADLGVDSIKHMEILLGVGERFRVQAEDGDQIT
ncbi:MAG: hypothetical protein H7Y22_02015, partial [Gemmatimonadaceae bacterium]|nr:hypothetical protein [Gloeobacterales cyanobacterium ES-bin-141]